MANFWTNLAQSVTVVFHNFFARVHSINFYELFMFLAYKDAVENRDGKYQNCTKAERMRKDLPCIVDLTSLGDCYKNSTDFKYGYDEEKPCFFMKLNRVGFSFLYQFVHLLSSSLSRQ